MALVLDVYHNLILLITSLDCLPMLCSKIHFFKVLPVSLTYTCSHSPHWISYTMPFFSGGILWTSECLMVWMGRKASFNFSVLWLGILFRSFPLGVSHRADRGLVSCCRLPPHPHPCSLPQGSWISGLGGIYSLLG